MLNKVQLIGHLGGDPETRYTNSGEQVTNFTMATKESWNDASGAKQERTEWHRIVVFGKLAEICAKYLNKGKLVYIGGKIQTRQWDDRDGNKRYTTEILANEMRIISSVKSENNDKDIPEKDETIPF